MGPQSAAIHTACFDSLATQPVHFFLQRAHLREQPISRCSVIRTPLNSLVDARVILKINGQDLHRCR